MFDIHTVSESKLLVNIVSRIVISPEVEIPHSKLVEVGYLIVEIAVEPRRICVDHSAGAAVLFYHVVDPERPPMDPRVHHS